MDKIEHRINHHTSLGTLVAAPNENGPIRLLQLSTHNGGLTQDGVPDMQHFGFQSSPPPGTQFGVLALRGDRSNAFVVASNHQATRPVFLKQGETILYDNQKQQIYLSGGNKIVASANQELDVIIGGKLVLSLTKDLATFFVPALFTENVTTNANLTVGTSATGTFTAVNGESVTVQDGIITNIF